MAQDTLAELMILVEAVGIDEAVASLQKAQKAMGDTAKKSKSDTKALEDFASKFAGALSIVAAGITTTVAALLVQVPIMGELFDSVKFFVETLAFALDGLLRPVIDVLIDAIFWLSDKFEALSPNMQKIILITGLVVAGIIILIAAGAALAIAMATGSVVVLALVAAFLTLIMHGIQIASILLLLSPIIIGLIVLWANFKDEILAVADAVTGALASFMSWLNSNFGEDFQVIMDELGVLWEDLSKTITFWVGVIQTVIGAVVGAIKAVWDSDFLGMKTAIILTFETIMAVLEPILKFIGDIIVNTIQIAIDIIQLILALLRGDWKTVWDEAKSIVSNFLDILTGFGEMVEDIFLGVGQIMVDSINSAIDSINGMSISIPDWVPVFGGKEWSPSIPKIPSLKKQGIIGKSGVAEVHAGEGVFAMQTLTDAMFNAMVMAGMDKSRDVNVFLDGHLVGQILARDENNDLGSQGGTF